MQLVWWGREWVKKLQKVLNIQHRKVVNPKRGWSTSVGSQNSVKSSDIEKEE